MTQAPSGPVALPENGRTNCATHVRTSTRSQTDNSLMRPGEIYLAQFPFGDVPGMKLRPVLLLTGAVGSCRKSWFLISRRSYQANFFRRISFWTKQTPSSAQRI